MLPKYITIFGLKIKIITKVNKQMLKDASRSYYKTMYGCYMPNERIIWINPEFCEEEQWRTLFHEIGHVVMFRTGVRFSGEVASGIEEIMVENNASAFFEFFNGMFPKFYED